LKTVSKRDEGGTEEREKGQWVGENEMNKQAEYLGESKGIDG